MTTINQLINKYQIIESLFMTKEITEFKKELLNFKAEQLKMLYVLESYPTVKCQKCKSEKVNSVAVGILQNIIGKDNLKMC